MSFQLAHYRMYGHSGKAPFRMSPSFHSPLSVHFVTSKPASTYESANTSAFKHGRTETIRSATTDSDAFCRAFCTEGVSDEERNELMRTAIKTHQGLTKVGFVAKRLGSSLVCCSQRCSSLMCLQAALTGKGWDRHMFALKDLALRNGQAVPAVFHGEAYRVLSEIILSTSTLSSPALDGGGFGPVGPNCYGIGYGFKVNENTLTPAPGGPRLISDPTLGGAGRG